jgi:hypothetical protein
MSRHKVNDVRYDQHSKFTIMAIANGWIMARRPDCMPFVVKEVDWANYSVVPCEKYISE